VWVAQQALPVAGDIVVSALRAPRNVPNSFDPDMRRVLRAKNLVWSMAFCVRRL